jgi:hypothetical protein
MADAARGIQACPGRREAGLFEGGTDVGGAGAGGDGGHDVIVLAEPSAPENQGFRIW